MARFVPLLLLVAILAGCTTTSVEQRAGALANLDISGYPSNVYVGISGPYSTEERMVEEAIVAVAKSIHLKAALALDSRLVTASHADGNLKSFASDDHGYWDDTHLGETIERLKIITVAFDREAGAVVVAEYPDEEASRRIYTSQYDRDGKPTWMSVLPQVEGHRFAVGSSIRYSLLNRSLEAADFTAAQNLLDLKSEHVFSIEKVSTYNDLMERVLYQAQRGLLRGFTIVDRYYDAESKSYWSLASCYE